MSELRPTSLDDFGFIEALREYVAAAPADPRITLSVDDSVDIAPHSGAALFRIVQEAMLNIRKHAGARGIWIDLARRADSMVEMRIRDDGRGFDPSLRVRGHFGLLTMRERAEALGGRLELQSRPGSGTELRIVIPMS
jgi:signal transduction histidine kinase